jgi:hypothetical protein
MVFGKKLKSFKKINFFQIKLFCNCILPSKNLYVQPQFSPDIPRYVSSFATGGPWVMGGNVVQNLCSDLQTSTETAAL